MGLPEHLEDDIEDRRSGTPIFVCAYQLFDELAQRVLTIADPRPLHDASDQASGGVLVPCRRGQVRNGAEGVGGELRPAAGPAEEAGCEGGIAADAGEDGEEVAAAEAGLEWLEQAAEGLGAAEGDCGGDLADEVGVADGELLGGVGREGAWGRWWRRCGRGGGVAVRRSEVAADGGEEAERRRHVSETATKANFCVKGFPV